MFLFLRYIDDFTTDFTFCWAPEALNGVCYSLIAREELFAVRTLDLILWLFVLCSGLACSIVDSRQLLFGLFLTKCFDRRCHCVWSYFPLPIRFDIENLLPPRWGPRVSNPFALARLWIKLAMDTSNLQMFDMTWAVCGLSNPSVWLASRSLIRSIRTLVDSLKFSMIVFFSSSVLLSFSLRYLISLR